MDFVFYDIIFLVFFAIFISIFLYTRKKNIKKEGLLLLYKTSWGIKLINRIGKKYKKTLKILSYVSIILGYFLMITMIYFFIKIVWIYIFSPEVVRAIKVPPIMPLIPYLPRVFKLTFLPPFYFTYWIIIIAVIAIPHELAHGIYAAYNKIKIKNTGFGFFPFFFPVFLAAFVEPDEKQMQKKSKFAQMSILSAGTFANVLTAIFFFFVLWGFFSLSFAPSGVVFDTYTYSVINTSLISMINNVSINNNSYENILDSLEGNEMNDVIANNKSFILSKSFLENSKEIFEKQGKVLLFDAAPAIKNELAGAITEINGIKIKSQEKLAEILSTKKPGETIEIKTLTNKGYEKKNITLEESPYEKGKALLGVGFIEKKSKGFLSKIFNIVALIKKPHVYYKPLYKYSEFIYNLLWWIVLISFSVALVNMLPIGIFDGGRFFYLTIAAITKSEKIAKKSFIGLTFLFLLLLALIMFFWVFSFL